MHAVERALGDAEEAEWRRTNPEARARAEGLTGQLQAAVDKLTAQIEAARTAGNTAKADKLASRAGGPPGPAGPGAQGPARVRRLTPPQKAAIRLRHETLVPEPARLTGRDQRWRPEVTR